MRREREKRSTSSQAAPAPSRLRRYRRRRRRRRRVRRCQIRCNVGERTRPDFRFLSLLSGLNGFEGPRLEPEVPGFGEGEIIGSLSPYFCLLLLNFYE